MATRGTRETGARRSGVATREAAKRRSMRWAVAAASTFLIAWGVSFAQEPPAADPAQGSEATAPATASREVRRSHRRERILEGIWWNQPPVIEALSLSDEQRREMDRRLEKTLDRRWQRAQELQAARQDLSRSLTAGDWEAAQAVGGRLSEISASVARDEVELKVDVLTFLTADQRKTFSEAYPAALSTSWLVGQRMRGRPERTGAGPGRRRAAPSKPRR